MHEYQRGMATLAFRCTCARSCTVDRQWARAPMGEIRSAHLLANPVSILRPALHFHAFSQIRSANIHTWQKDARCRRLRNNSIYLASVVGKRIGTKNNFLYNLY